MLSAILFDLDGTLVKTDSLHYTIWETVLNELSIVIDQEFYNKYISGKTNAQIVKEIFPDMSAEAGLKLADDKEARFRELATTLKPLNGLSPLLDWIDSKGIKTAVVTNAPRENAKFLLEVTNLTEVFPIVILGEEAKRGKPHPDPYLLALEKLQVTASEAIAFEDSPTGIRAAVAAGIYTIGVKSEHNPDIILANGAKMVISDFTDAALWELLTSLMKYDR